MRATWLLSLSFAGCPPCHTGEQPSVFVSPDAQGVPVIVDPVGAPSWPLGAWTSEPCGGRAYPRQVTFSSDHRFSARDLVSPCPPGVQCVWSGIISWGGSWRIEGDHLLLEIETTAPEGAPSSLWRVGGGSLGEPAGDCLYTLDDGG